MKAEFWVLLSAGKNRRGLWQMNMVPQARINKPASGANQIAVRMTIEVPDSYFDEPQIHAKISIPETGGTRQELTAELSRSMAEHLKNEFGVSVNFLAEAPQ